MSLMQCPHCAKQYSINEQQAGLTAQCSCGKQFKIPGPALAPTPAPAVVSANPSTCPGCQQPILAAWKACPACGTRLGAAAVPTPLPPPVPSGAPLVQAGENSVVKANINQPVHMNVPGGSPTVRPAGVGPMIQAGDNAVIKAEVNASTNIHNDRSVNVQGQYIANQTIVNESSVGTIVRMLVGAFTDNSAAEIEKSLPTDPGELYSILAQTLAHQVRQEKLIVRRLQQGFFSSGQQGVSTSPWAQMKKDRQAKKETVQRHELCQKILSKLHDHGYRSGDRQLLSDIDRLDACMMTSEFIRKKNESIPVIRTLLMVGCAPWAALLFLGFLGALFSGSIGPAFGVFFLVLVAGGIAVGGYFYCKSTLATLDQKIAEIEMVTEELARRNFQLSSFASPVPVALPSPPMPPSPR